MEVWLHSHKFHDVTEMLWILETVESGLGVSPTLDLNPLNPTAQTCHWPTLHEVSVVGIKEIVGEWVELWLEVETLQK